MRCYLQLIYSKGEKGNKKNKHDSPSTKIKVVSDLIFIFILNSLYVVFIQDSMSMSISHFTVSNYIMSRPHSYTFTLTI